MRRRLLIPTLCLAALTALGACKKKRRAAPPVEGAAPEALEPLAEPAAAIDPAAEAAASPEAAAAELTAQVAAARAEDEKLMADPKVKEEIKKFCAGVYEEIKKVRATDKGKLPPKETLMATCTALPPYALRCIEPEFASKNQQACEAYVGSLPKEAVDGIGRMFAWMEGKDPEEGEAAAGDEAEAEEAPAKEAAEATEAKGAKARKAAKKAGGGK